MWTRNSLFFFKYFVYTGASTSWSTVSATTRDTRIRNSANGYVFCRDVLDPPEGLRELALKASHVTQSDFKGVDIGYNEKLDQLFVIEVNSAPGIEGSNVTDYVNTILNYGK